MVAFSQTTREIKGQGHFQGAWEMTREADASQPQGQPCVLFKDNWIVLKFLSFVMASSPGVFFSRKLWFLNFLLPKHLDRSQSCE